MNYEPNTTDWQIGDLVIHDADAKSEDMLMVVIDILPGVASCYRTMYVNQGPEAKHRRFKIKKKQGRDTLRVDVFDNRKEVLHEPARFSLKSSRECQLIHISDDVF